MRGQGAGGSTAQGQASAKGRQGRGSGLCGKEAGQGRALRFTPAKAHLAPVALPRLPLVCKEPSAAPLGRNRAHCSLRSLARHAPCAKRAFACVPLAALPLPCHIALFPPASALPGVGFCLPLLRCAPCPLQCVYICKLFTFINVNFTFVNCSHL